jgi:hypothetical protein
MKVKKLSYLSSLFLVLLTTQCIKDDGVNSVPTNCDALTLIDSFTYENAATSPYTINSAVLNDDCLVINISASGCDGNSWLIELLDSGGVSDSNPPQRSTKLFLTNDEDCLTVINRVRSFDLSTLQIDDASEIMINIDGLSEPILYSY